MTVIQIVPRRLASADGVADYAGLLAEALAAGHGMQSVFLSGDPGERGTPTDADATNVVVMARTAAGLDSAIEACVAQSATESSSLFLHYVNYGYATRGCPLWLLEGLERWKRAHPPMRLITMFHELYASGAPWQSAFWLSPIQRHIAKRIWEISDAAITSLTLIASHLEAWQPRGARPLLVLPVFSNVPEPKDVRPWGDRDPKIVVFGRAGIESRVYGVHRGLLAQACRELAISEIIDIGPRVGPVPKQVDGVQVTSLGHLPAETIGTILTAAKAGFLDYSSRVLEKSGVFAAYAAYGVLPVITTYANGMPTGLQEGVHYWALGRAYAAESAKPDFSQIGSSLRAWYENHSLRTQAATVARLLRGATTPP